jgi:ribose transport system substrate-binding protein
MKKISLLLAIILIISAFAIAGCDKAEAKEQEGFTIGVSNGYIGNGWRTQMLDSIDKLGEYYKGKGFVKEIIVQNAGLDVNTQIAHIRNMINSGVDLLLIDPNSETALNPVIEEAKAANIPVIAFDQPVDNDYAMNIVIDQVTWGENLAKWFCDELGGEGQIVIVSGIAGSPANVNRLKGMQSVLDQNPGIEVLTEVNGNWDQASAQQAMSNLLASYPDIDGVLTQDGMALGVVNAFEAANRDIPVVTGELMMGYVKKWYDLNESVGFSSYGQNNPPGIGATALGIGIRLLQGKELKEELTDNTYYYSVKDHVTNENLDTYYDKNKDKPDAYFIDEWLTEEELDAMFK